MNKKFNFDYLASFLKINNYEIYSKNGDKLSLQEILQFLDKLDKVHDTIGNYYLISNDRKELLEEIFN